MLSHEIQRNNRGNKQETETYSRKNLDLQQKKIRGNNKNTEQNLYLSLKNTKPYPFPHKKPL